MYDIGLLRDGGLFDPDPSATTRLALVHRGFHRPTEDRGLGRQRFGARFPGLGLLNLAHSLRVDARLGRIHLPEFRYFDDAVFDDEATLTEGVKDWLAPANRRIVAATSYTPTVDRLERFLARFDPRWALLVVGGPHATLAPDLEPAHVVVRGEGGAALRHILNYILNADFGTGADAQGICYLLDGRAVSSKQAFDQSVALLPSPGYAYDLLPENVTDLPVYATNFTRMIGKRPQVYVCTQSCRARCTFCSTYLIHGRSVARSLDKIRLDLEHLLELGHDSIEFHDDDLAQHPDFDELLEVLGQLGVPWFCYMRTEALDHARARAMADSGCRRVFLGVESMQQGKLDYFGKRVNVDDNVQAVTALAEAGIGTVAGFIIGAPDDTVQSIVADVQRLLDLPLLGINCSILSPDPGTVEYTRASKRNVSGVVASGPSHLRVIPDLDRYGAALPVGLPTVCDGVEKDDLNRLLTLIDGAFYYRTHVWAGLVTGRTHTQVDMVRAYYRYVAQSVERLSDQELAFEIAELRDKVLGLIRSSFWSDQGVFDDQQQEEIH